MISYNRLKIAKGKPETEMTYPLGNSKDHREDL